MTLLEGAILILTGFSEGLVLGAGTVAFLTFLGVIQRLMKMTRTYRYVHAYQWAVVLGSVSWTLFAQLDLHFALPNVTTIMFGLFSGMFVGMLAAALTEVLNVLPLLAKRLGMVDRVMWLLSAIILGKVVASLLFWLIISPHS
ncbi:stage V sporulation protein AB [Alkalihalobacillus alcalophilus ATCC 27647 = CGMCC 1.3604]|uniref:Stage V sporulation protein AB n=1 Tax=Alkalihalobacillus alcalophilus ATCC 27647 = CGMCC 1.3604 TaxID=1218173 RepID=A0A094XAL3_ALKAL|nr:stage V sporulation protein AB [Alkalihalobacillus alcalophilus]KGA95805.1 stage V sporulation protein AB [Alkalihalobacillus alcalophilus ATCC 27647 = CGMCC 1.3604]MED1563201.1 stage V sporulation protein AB [Alkalihalobacillus alcalophilus]THG91059.1 stage V sporulation protein AB [Alkalihalobacillus alcalophilus ATCC 27647 = CGMCC 1.3604]